MGTKRTILVLIALLSIVLGTKNIIKAPKETELTISQQGINFIKQQEGYKSRPYRCVGGRLTIGHGSTLIDGRPISREDMVTEAQAETILIDHLNMDCNGLNQLSGNKLNQGQFDALCSLTYNIGPTALYNSTIARKLKNGDILEVADEFKKWNKVTKNGKLIALKGLSTRRELEKDIFLHGHK